MKTKIIITFLLIGTLTLQSCGIIQQLLEQTQQLATFTKCEFKMKTLTNTKLVGLDIQNKKKFSDFKFMDAANVTKTLLSGNLPLSFQLNIEAKNPNQKIAAMQKIAWKLYIDDILMTTGNVNKAISIPPGGTENLPIQIKLDLKELLKKETKTAILNFGFNLADAGNYPTRVRLDIKPTINISGTPIEYPGYFTLKKEFGSK